MKRASRLMVIVGAGLLACPAFAVAATAAGPAPGGIQAPFNADVIGYFSNQNDCNWAGRAGSSQNRWVKADCDQVRNGSNKGMWRLTAQRRGNGNGNNNGNGNGNNNGNGNGNNNGNGNGNGNNNGNGNGNGHGNGNGPNQPGPGGPNMPGRPSPMATPTSQPPVTTGPAGAPGGNHPH